MGFFRIILYVIIAIVVLLIIYSIIHNKIKAQIIKINSAENKIDESLRLKYDLLVKIVSEIKNDALSSFEFERKIADIESKMYTFKNENIKINKNNTFNDLWYEIINLNTKIIAEEKYYNENTTIYNNLVSKFPSKIVAKILRLKEKKYFDGKDMYDKNIKDFKI